MLLLISSLHCCLVSARDLRSHQFPASKKFKLNFSSHMRKRNRSASSPLASNTHHTKYFSDSKSTSYTTFYCARQRAPTPQP